MASRYWVGGTANWDGTAGSKWATTSGGAGGASAPTSTDDVFFDANSGTVTVSSSTVGFDTLCKNFNMTGFTGTIGVGTFPIRCFGSFTGSASGGGFGNDITIQFRSTSVGETITTNGMSVCGITIIGAGCEYTLQDNYTQRTTGSNLSFIVDTGTLKTNGKTVTVAQMFISGTNTRTLDITNSTIYLKNSSLQFCFSSATITNLTFVSTGSTIYFEGANANSGTNAPGLAFNNIVITGNGNLSQGIFGAGNSFNDITVYAGTTLKLNITGVTTVVSITSLGTAANLANIISSSSGTPAALSKASGLLYIDKASIQDIQPYLSATNIISRDGNNVSGNTGINFIETSSFF